MFFRDPLEFKHSQRPLLYTRGIPLGEEVPATLISCHHALRASDVEFVMNRARRSRLTLVETTHINRGALLVLTKPPALVRVVDVEGSFGRN